jgi:hypothetical protein
MFHGNIVYLSLVLLSAVDPSGCIFGETDDREGEIVVHHNHREIINRKNKKIVIV